MNQDLQEKRNHLKARLLSLIEEGPEDSEAYGYERTFDLLGISSDERAQLRTLSGNPGIEVLAKIFRLRIETLESKLKYREDLSHDEQNTILQLWRAMSLVLDDITEFPRMAERVHNPSIEENDEGELEL